MSAYRLLFALVIPLGFGACKKTVDTKGFEKTIEERVKTLGLSPQSVSCPSDVEAATGAKFTCKVTIDQATYDLDVTITAVKDKDVSMDTAWAKGRAVVRKKIVDNLPAELGKQLEATVTVDCGKDALLFLTNNQLECSLSSGKTRSKLALSFDENYNMTGWELHPGLLSRKRLVAALEPSMREQTKTEVTVDCGPDELMVRPADGNVFCTATNANETAKVKVTTKEDLSLEKWEVVAP